MSCIWERKCSGSPSASRTSVELTATHTALPDGVQVAALGAVAGQLALEHRPARLPVGLEVVRVGDRGDRQALELLRACSR